MAATYKTRCPHCGAQFRISEDHLKQAGGAVRCGSCLKVFQASENLVKDAPGRAAAPAARQPAKPAPAPAAKAPAARPAAKPAAKPAASPAARSAAKPAGKPAAAPEKWSLPKAEQKPADKPKWTMDDVPAEKESDALDRDYDDKSVTRQEYKGNDTSISLGSLELSDSFNNLDHDDDETLRSEDFSDMAGAAHSSQGSGDESWAEKLLEELDEEPAPTSKGSGAKAGKTAKTGKKATPAPADDSPEGEDWASEAESFFGDAEPAPATAASKPPADDWADEAEDFFTGLDFDESQGTDDENIGAIELPEVEKRAMRRPTLPRPDFSGLDMGEMLKWGALSAGAMLVLGIQYLLFNFDQLARTPEWRGFYATVCSAAGCTLPNPSNVTKLHGSNLVVRSHPAAPGALIVDVIVFNEADYEQPFPTLELGFFSLDGQPVASRAFTPDEYRRGELASMPLMPMDTPVHISFEIMDPGDQAVNYTLRFRPAPSQDRG